MAELVLWMYVPLAFTVQVGPAEVNKADPEFRTVPLITKSVPVPFARVHPKLLFTVTCPPASTVTWSTVTFAATVTVCPLRIVMVPCELLGVVVAVCQFVPSSEHSQIDVLPQFPVAMDRNCVVLLLAQAASARGAGSTPYSPATSARLNTIISPLFFMGSSLHAGAARRGAAVGSVTGMG